MLFLKLYLNFRQSRKAQHKHNYLNKLQKFVGPFLMDFLKYQDSLFAI